MPVKVYRFADFELDCDRFELRRNERSLKLERKPMELLILLAAKNGHLVTRAEIAEQLWDQEIFVDTEHGINTAIRKIRQALRDDSERPRFVQTVTGKGYRFIGAFEEERGSAGVGPAGPDAVVARAEEPLVESAPMAVEADDAPVRRRLPWMVWGVAAFAAALVILAGVHRWRGGRVESLAVLPLVNVSGDAGQDYVADGMTDELITMLAKSSTLRIPSRTSVMQYKGVRRPLPEIARELGVDGVLEGSVRRNGDSVHLTIQLIRAADDTHLWAESYDREANDLVGLPKDAAQAIAKRLNRAVPQEAKARYVSPDAHDAYLRGRYLWFTDHTEEAGPYFKRATELQPDYALGWSGLSTYYGASAVKGELSPAESMKEVEATARKALDLDESLPEAHLAMAGAQMESWNLAQADAETRRATELDPRFAEAYHLRAKILEAENRPTEAIAAQRTATEIDPFTRPWAMALALMETRQLDAAIAEANEKLVAYPNNTILLGLMHEIYQRKGVEKESVEMLSRALVLEGRGAEAESVRRIFREKGFPDVVRWKLNRARKVAEKRYVSPVLLASMTARLGDREVALALLEEAFRQHATALLWIQDDPAFDALHAEERYRAIVRQVGLPLAY